MLSITAVMMAKGYTFVEFQLFKDKGTPKMYNLDTHILRTSSRYKIKVVKFFGFQILCSTFSYDKEKMNMFSYDGHIN